jgi:hypothetical protein
MQSAFHFEGMLRRGFRVRAARRTRKSKVEISGSLQFKKRQHPGLRQRITDN